MDPAINYYEVLQVSPNASQEVIEAAYKRLAKMYHPDTGGDEEKMKIINEAYEVLSDPDLRFQYDNFRKWYCEDDKEKQKKKEEPNVENITSQKKEVIVHPWPRFWARTIDLMLWAFILGIIGVFYHAIFKFYDYTGFLPTAVTIATWVFVEAYLISAYGTTPGKWLLKIHVFHKDGSRLSYAEAIKRSLFALGYGYAFGIPLLNLIFLFNSYSYLKKNHLTLWDMYLNSHTTHGEISLIRKIVAAMFVIGIWVIIALGEV
ncbi:DnaJ domain-containing protein [Moorella sulfitireducens]|uniref:DnaJ domain-containing protein n=1 Tax=Neomoorella sulfitireducens TaxID=2972948 RepID=UPI002413D325|nr:DnaJ domain-containing protein [Moorella sulfitireducens]